MVGIRDKTRKMLLKLGADPSDNGYRYLTEAIAQVVEDDTRLDFMMKLLYPSVANVFGSTVSATKRSIRTTIDKMHRANSKINSFDSVSPLLRIKNKPSSFIAICAEIIELEIWEDEFNEL